MIKQKAIVLLRKIVFSVFASACLFSCKNFESDLGSFFESYGNVASVKSVTYSRPLYTGDGSYAIDSDSDFTVSYIIDNPGNFPLIVATNSSHTKMESNNLITRSYTAAELAALELAGGKITTSFTLIGIAPNGKYLPQSAYYGPDILCNSPPPAINNAMGQMQNDPASSINERLVVCVQLPLLKGALDWKSFVVTDKRTETVHSYGFAKIDGSRTNAIQNGTESNGWTIYNSANPPSMMWPTYSGGPTFSWMTGEGAVYYIVTDVNNLSSVEPFQIALTLKDDSGLTNPIEIPSHAVKLAPPTCNINVASVSNTLDQAYVEFIIHAPANASDATLHYAIADSSGNPVADTSGSATEHVGDATFRLYPKLDGSAENYTISQTYASKTGWMDSDDAAATFGGGGTISVTGVQLGAPTCNLVDGQTYPQETELVITSPEAADVGWIYNINSGAFITGSAPSPASIRLEEAGAYAFAYYTQKDYYEKSATVNLRFDVSLTALYVASYGLDTNAGTKAYPFGTIQHAIDTFAAGSSPSSPDNSVYILDDMTSINGLTSMGSGYVNIVGCNGGESGVPGTPVALFCAHDKTVIQLSGGTMSLRAISITGIDGTSNGAVYVSGGTFILKDKVTITGNKKTDGTAMNVNIGSGVITVDANGISGTKVGVTSASAPSLGSPVEITSGYGTSASASDSPMLHFASDNASYGIGLNAAGTEAALVTGGGSIDIGDIASVSFAAAGSAGVYTVKATATPTSGSPLDITSEVTSWSLKLYYLNTYTGMTSATNTLDLSALGEGTYIMKIRAVYGGKTYSGEVEIVKGPVGFVVVEGSTVVGGDKFKDANSNAGVFVAGRSVAISTFWICDHEVTQAEYQAVMGTNPSNFTGDNLPVEKVSWYDALVYCNKKSIAEGLEPCYTINGKTNPDEWGTVPTSSDATWNAATCDFTKKGYRLPTEAEWEYAARGGKVGCEAANPTDWAGTDSEAELGKYAWYSSNKTHEVKTEKQAGVNSANGLGIYDMSGNVKEWCWDFYNDIYSSTDWTGPAGASSGSYRVGRGGSWFNDADDCSVACRSHLWPDVRDYYIGFRVVRNAP